jgi:hypothetical protein
LISSETACAWAPESPRLQSRPSVLFSRVTSASTSSSLVPAVECDASGGGLVVGPLQVLPVAVRPFQSGASSLRMRRGGSICRSSLAWLLPGINSKYHRVRLSLVAARGAILSAVDVGEAPLHATTLCRPFSFERITQPLDQSSTQRPATTTSAFSLTLKANINIPG